MPAVAIRATKLPPIQPLNRGFPEVSAYNSVIRMDLALKQQIRNAFLAVLTFFEKKEIRKTLITALGFVVLLGAVKGCQIYKAIREHARFAQPPEAVTTALVKQEFWRDSFQTVGFFAAVKGSTLGMS